MLPVQVDYWKYVETSRANRANEALKRQELGIRSYEAESGRMTASANLQNADTNVRNAEINARNAEINALNAESNRMNAISQARQAGAAERQASSAERNAASNAQNAQTNAYNALTQADKVRVDMYDAETRRMNYELARDEQNWKLYGEGYDLEARKVAANELSALGSYTRGDAAQMDATTRKKTYELAQTKQPFEIESLEAQTQRMQSETARNSAETDLTKAKTTQTKSDTWRSWVETITDVGATIGSEARSWWNTIKGGKNNGTKQQSPKTRTFQYDVNPNYR